MTIISACSGSHGFIGGHLTRYLQGKGHRVKRLDRSGKPLLADYYYDFSAYGNLYNQTDPIEIYKANVLRSLHLLERTKTIPYKGFIAVSTSSVMLPKQTFYSESKMAMERITKQYPDKPIIIIRPFTVVGTGEPDCHLIPKLIDSCFNKVKMPFVSEAVHDFIDVRDLIEAVYLLSQNAEKYKGEVFEIGNGLQYTNEMVKMIVEDVIGYKANIKRVKGLRSYDTTEWKADNSKLKKLGWKPKISLTQTIKDMIADYFPGV